MKLTLYIAFLLVLPSCNYFVQKVDKTEDKGIVVAKVGEKQLYKIELEGLVSKETSKEDSIKITKQFVENWVKRQLLLMRAEENISFDENEINKKVEDYRYQLMVYEYKKEYVKQKLNENVSEEEIEKFYLEHKDNFELKENIVRCHYLKIPLSAPKLKKVKQWFYSSQEKNYIKLKEYGHEHAINYSFEDSTWFLFNEIVKDSPLKSIPNQTNYLQHHKHILSTDSNFIYLMKINEYKISNEISPIDFVSDKIRNIIINKRKTELIRTLEQGIFTNAKNNNKFEIYI